MSSFMGLGKKHVERHYRKTRSCVYLHLKRNKREIPQESAKNDEEKQITKMAIGVAGGFDVDGGKRFEFDEMSSIVVLPEFEYIALPNNELPEIVKLAVDAILSSDSAATIERAKALSGTWDGEKRVVSKHTENLIQHDRGIRIPPKDWKCGMCDKTENLWLNLTDGTILCGRRFFDGSGGNNHALEHYKTCGYPLAVKLGTITPHGADVFSYDEDEMVEDPWLTKHLAHFGINVSLMEKTDKSIAELEIDINKRIGEWATIQESGSHLVPIYGPGYTGLANLGNSCYLNSVVQVIFSIPDFKAYYADNAEEIFDNCTADPVTDLGVQMAKLGHGLLSGQYSMPISRSQDTSSEKNNAEIDAPPGIQLGMFKSLIGKGHQEFSTSRQQDAQEFFLHLINLLERHNRGGVNPSDCFKYQEEDRYMCIQSSKYKYVHSTQYILRLPIPLGMESNKEVANYELKKKEAQSHALPTDPVRPRISMEKCLDYFMASNMVPDFYSTALKAKSMAVRTVRLSTFPDYLMIQLEKFTFEDGWIPKKLDVSIDVPDVLNLEHLRGTGLRPGEEMLPEENVPPATLQLDEDAVLGLAEMGFPLEACKRAVYITANQGLETAMSWIMEHMNDPDFSDPFLIEGRTSFIASGTQITPNEESIRMIMSMGFTQEQACKALRATDNNLERAADWIFSHADELDSENMDTTEPGLVQPKCKDGPSKYRLLAFISHMGTSTMVGHYVCHILKDGKWVIFNDDKVALSESPPKDLGYLYLYQRI